MNIIPNFLLIGAAKSGTTAISQQLSRHPEVCMSQPKEPFFFNRTEVWERGVSWYQKQCFGHYRGEPCIGEATTEYSLRGVYPDTAARIRLTLGAPKIIYLIREPLSRIESMWMELRSQGLETSDFESAVRQRRWYVDGSRYFYQLSAFLSFIPETRFLVITHDEITKSAATSLRRICRFLEIDDAFAFPSPDKRVYASAGKRQYTRFAAILRQRLPGFRAIRDLTPGGLRTTASLLLKRPFETRPTWTSALREATWAAIERDAQDALSFAGTPDTLHAWRSRALAEDSHPTHQEQDAQE